MKQAVNPKMMPRYTGVAWRHAARRMLRPQRVCGLWSRPRAAPGRRKADSTRHARFAGRLIRERDCTARRATSVLRDRCIATLSPPRAGTGRVSGSRSADSARRVFSQLRLDQADVFENNS